MRLREVAERAGLDRLKPGDVDVLRALASLGHAARSREVAAATAAHTAQSAAAALGRLEDAGMVRIVPVGGQPRGTSGMRLWAPVEKS